MWITIVLLGYLVVLGVTDIRRRTVSVFALAVGGILTVCIGIVRCMSGELSWLEMGVGIIPGIFLLLVARVSRKAGYADGVVLVQIGISLGCREVLLLFGGSMFLLAIVSIVLLITGKVKKETKMPYLAFLSIAFGILQL